MQVDVNTISPTTEHTGIEVDWTETARDPSGGVVSVARWKAILTVAVNPPSDENVLQVNSIRNLRDEHQLVEGRMR